MPLFNSSRPIRSVLIANRGEIALRVMRTCARLGIRTIAVYSDADADALHVKLADEAVRIGPPPARASYLDINAILAAAKQSGADAIHPGYGFLSENAGFVRACEAAGLVFVGPALVAVEKMGSKIESKRIAEAADVPTVPGYHGDAQDDATLAQVAAKIGFPVLIKASAGGGGRGMRRVDRDADFVAQLNAAKAEAEAAFGDNAVLLEKFILNPRHLEVQLAGDRNGNLVHLFERDCSVQRNNQKVLEEAPAPNLPASVRQKLYDAALKLGRAIGYDSVGTVEFIMDQDSDSPYFLEMNTRLQVEHPVTEFITGIDLVEWQLLAAAGEKLPLTQDQIRCQGHAIEARITAERADLAFQPVTGELSVVDAPRGLRFDTGVAAGSQVSLYYDSLLAKLIAHGPDRSAALARLDAGLSDLTLLGVTTTQAFLRDAVRQPLFADGKATTRFIETSFPGGWKPNTDDLLRLRAAACALWAQLDTAKDTATWINPWRRRIATRVTSAVRPAKVLLQIIDEYGEIDADLHASHGRISIEIDGVAIGFEPSKVTSDAIILTAEGHNVPFVARLNSTTVSITHRGLTLRAAIRPRIDIPRDGGGPERSGNAIEAPLHGVVAKLHVALGDVVEKGTPVLQMEAMKLIHTLKATVPGRIEQINCNVGDTVPAGAILIEIAPAEVEEKP
ncbi:biotin carboxylase N-terminal domain-containing protein [Bradyrhizobium symbiodeficiens]|uniref:Biotin carboxylase N-terminal domain-containing protein n=1 Tax=Bradyrhizobium symbiodeficiens TaxID=1404367 RepID=A0ABX5WHJ1_9BRAD|nr:biotin carboxylase N-terminal domain-containing protein [Bradyrhizobium symbiodeficiens]